MQQNSSKVLVKANKHFNSDYADHIKQQLKWLPIKTFSSAQKFLIFFLIENLNSFWKMYKLFI